VLCQQPALPAVVPLFVPPSIFFSLLPVLPLFISYLIFVLTAFLIVGLTVVCEQPLHCHCHGHFVVLPVFLVVLLCFLLRSAALCFGIAMGLCNLNLTVCGCRMFYHAFVVAHHPLLAIKIYQGSYGLLSAMSFCCLFAGNNHCVFLLRSQQQPLRICTTQSATTTTAYLHYAVSSTRQQPLRICATQSATPGKNHRVFLLSNQQHLTTNNKNVLRQLCFVMTKENNVMIVVVVEMELCCFINFNVCLLLLLLLPTWASLRSCVAQRTLSAVTPEFWILCPTCYHCDMTLM